MGAGEGGVTSLSTWKPNQRTCRLPAAPKGRYIKKRCFSDGKQKRKCEFRQGRHMKENAILLTHASQLLTLRGEPGLRRGPQMLDLGIIEDGAVLIENAKISAVGTTDELRRVPQVRAPHLGANLGTEELDCSGKVILPGFVDSHTHPVFAAPRPVSYTHLRAHETD